MNAPREAPAPVRMHHEQMLKLVAKGFYNELINYGVNEAEVLTVAGHLLDNVVKTASPPDQANAAGKATEYYNRIFTRKDVRDEWAAASRLGLHDVTIQPLDPALTPQVAAWLQAPTNHESFYPRFPEREAELRTYFQSPERAYFAVFQKDGLAGIIGAENIDGEAAKLEMRKLVGDPSMQGAGIGKRATFLFLYHVFVIRQFKKVYLHSLDINIRNLNLNGKFGFELEGVFFEEAMLGDRWRDVVRMALTQSRWQRLFA